ncbi:MAG: hypothetical protein IKF38_02210 [Clostridia bacterium]|nr:hypothetical protein [Clostridia bacterium]
MRQNMSKDRNLVANNTKLKNVKSIGCKNLKTNARGITLIALVITVIVLLILAGVSILAITGNESAMEKAKEATDKTKESSEIEQIKLAYVNLLAENNLEKITANQLQNELVNNFNLDVSVEEHQMYYENTSNTCFPKEFETTGDYTKDTISKVFTLQGKENIDIKEERIFLITNNKEFKWYYMTESGIVNTWNPVTLVKCKTSISNSQNSIYVESCTCYRSKNYECKEFGILYGTNKNLGADTSVNNYAATPFSYEYVDNTLRFADNTYTTLNKKIIKSPCSNPNSKLTFFYGFNGAVGSNVNAYVASRGYAIYENNYTHETKIYYSEPVYVTYNQVKALE